jgi:hypothetical protein
VRDVSELYLTPGIIETIGRLRERPVDDMLAAHLLAMFGQGGKVARLREAKDTAWASCANNDDRQCYDPDCGYCQPFYDGPLLDEVLSEIHGFEDGNLTFDEKGELIEIASDVLPF